MIDTLYVIRAICTNERRSKWTDEEDKLLMDSVRKYGEKNWQQGNKNSSTTYVP